MAPNPERRRPSTTRRLDWSLYRGVLTVTDGTREDSVAVVSGKIPPLIAELLDAGEAWFYGDAAEDTEPDRVSG